MSRHDLAEDCQFCGAEVDADENGQYWCRNTGCLGICFAPMEYDHWNAVHMELRTMRANDFRAGQRSKAKNKSDFSGFNAYLDREHQKTKPKSQT